MDIPKQVSGRTVTNRGVHLQPFGFHGGWMNRHAYWTDLLRAMGMSWVVLINEGDSVLQNYGWETNPLKVLLDAGVIPIIREQRKLPDSFSDINTVRATVQMFAEYGVKPLWIVRNEPFDDREWDAKWMARHNPTREDMWATFMGVWADAARQIVGAGAYIGFPDGPGYDFNPFNSLKAWGCKGYFDAGQAFYAGHHYGKGRPVAYPYDDVSQLGTPLTEAQYRQALDDFADDPAWHDVSLDAINLARAAQAMKGKTALDDDTCWRGWEKVANWSIASFGYIVPMAMTEGGWVPRDRAGSGPDCDLRWPLTTPRMVATLTLEMFSTPSPMFAICPWLLADEDMGGSGWPFDAWHGWAYEERYGRQKPVIAALMGDAPPPPPPPVDEWAGIREQAENARFWAESILGELG